MQQPKWHYVARLLKGFAVTLAVELHLLVDILEFHFQEIGKNHPLLNMFIDS